MGRVIRPDLNSSTEHQASYEVKPEELYKLSPSQEWLQWDHFDPSYALRFSKSHPIALPSMPTYLPTYPLFLLLSSESSVFAPLMLFNELSFAHYRLLLPTATYPLPFLSHLSFAN